MHTLQAMTPTGRTVTFSIDAQPASGHGDIDGYTAACPCCGYRITYSIARMVAADMGGHISRYCTEVPA